MQRKSIWWLLVLVLLVAGMLVVAACGDEEEAANGEEATEEPIDDPVEATRARLLEDIQAIAARITPENGDAHEAIVASGGRDGAEYQQWNDLLWPMVDEFDATYIYTVVMVDDENVGLVVDAAESLDDTDPWMTQYEIEWQMQEAFEGRAAVRQDEPWTDEAVLDGAPHLSAFAPVYNSAGEIVAIVGIDAEVK